MGSIIDCWKVGLVFEHPKNREYIFDNFLHYQVTIHGHPKFPVK